MARREGFWLDSNALELVPIYDHIVFLSELEAKVRNDLDLTRDEKRWAASLGMAPGKGWGAVTREAPGARKLRFMTDAMKAGWVRIRAHSDLPRVTCEFWGMSDSLMAAIAFGLKKAGVSPKAEIELHNVEAERAWTVTAASLYARLSGESTSEQDVEVGFSVYSNPPKGKAYFHRWGSKRDAPGVFDNPGGDFHTRQTGHFDAIEPARLYGGLRRFHLNPAELDAFVSPEEGQTVAKIFLGLKRGFGKRSGRDIKVDEVVQLVKKARRKQLEGDLPGGASFITQRGFFTDWKKKHLHPDEDSLQILIYPEFDGGETKESFAKNAGALAKLLSDYFEQESVVLHVVVDDETSFLGHAHQ